MQHKHEAYCSGLGAWTLLVKLTPVFQNTKQLPCCSRFHLHVTGYAAWVGGLGLCSACPTTAGRTCCSRSLSRHANTWHAHHQHWDPLHANAQRKNSPAEPARADDLISDRRKMTGKVARMRAPQPLHCLKWHCWDVNGTGDSATRVRTSGRML